MRKVWIATSGWTYDGWRCHRVVRKDGTLGGYRGGIKRKRALLARERAAIGAR